jgi:hypothetical protein
VPDSGRTSIPLPLCPLVRRQPFQFIGHATQYLGRVLAVNHQDGEPGTREPPVGFL